MSHDGCAHGSLASVFFASIFLTLMVLQIGSEEILVGLSSRGQLYALQHLVSAECSSFAVHDAFLLYTTFSHQLRIVPFGSNVSSTLEQVAVLVRH